ncbi:MAG: DEAD/DEAH box helicase [Bradymonadaceae bacterium]|nr:DEAD/DEAH box helicase [Lujinxingiaceae bacterium]
MNMPATIHDWLAQALAVGLEGGANREPTANVQLADFQLADFQLAGVERAVDIARRFGGVVLADGVGLGKTRMGLAIAQALARDAGWTSGAGRAVYGCVPSRLRQPWQRAAASAGWKIPGELRLLSHTELSLRPLDTSLAPPAVILVDEAHQFRNPDSQRSRNLAELATHAPIVLLTATPICNSIWDLYHLFALFLAQHDLRDTIGMNLHDAFVAAEAGEYDLTELVERLVIRRSAALASVDFGAQPSVRLEILDYDPHVDERWMWNNLGSEIARLSLVLLRDDWPRGLFLEFVLKRWESGPEALCETLQMLVDYHRRWLEAQSLGRILSRPDFHRLFDAAASQNQTVFAFVYEERDDSELVSLDKDHLEMVRADRRHLEALLARARRLVEARSGSVQAITRLLSASSDEKLLIFTSYQHAAQGLYDAICEQLGAQARVGLVTGRGAQATGLGKVAAHEIIRRFAPRAAGEPAMALHQQLDVLVCTDCLSEGINLQDCGRVVMADLPYTPLRVEQRIGRLVRPGSAHNQVLVYLPRPREWNDTLGLRRRLNHKLEHAHGAGATYAHATVLDGAPREREAPEAEPLAALTTLDRLARRLGAESWPPPDDQCPRHFVTDVPGAQAQLWLRTLLEGGHRPLAGWCMVDHTARVEWRLSKLVRALVALSDLLHAVRPGAAAPLQLAAATDALLSREQFLQAAHLAPMPLGQGAPQLRIWHNLVAWSRAHPHEALEHDLDNLRQRLLRPFPRGIERQLAELVAQNLEPQRLLRRLSKLSLALPASPVRLSVVFGLQINGC